MLGRLKFNITQLVDEILDILPNEVWSSSTTTFLDPAMGGGQFVANVERRLQDAGHSNENIASRVYGYESNRMRINFAVNKYKLVGIYTNKNFLEEDSNMKFDVIVGNPPYQNPGKSKGEKLWYRFIRKSVDLLNDDGYLAFVTPNSWMTGGTNMSSGKWGVLKDVFCNYQLIYANVHNITKRYFPKIGIQISYWAMQKSKITKDSVIELNDKTIEIDLTKADILSSEPNSLSMSVVNKVLHNTSNEVFEVQYFQHHTKPGTYHEEDTPTGKYSYAHWIMGSDATNDLSIRYINFDKSPTIRYNKIIMPVTTRYWQPYLDLDSIGALAQGYAIKVDSNVTQDGFKSVFYSNIFCYINKKLQIDKTGCMKTNIVRKLPKLDMSKIWTNDELYNYFNLTQDEIDYIEANS
tara:strand:+ start:503 stop:1726 length:1224 start_codon:yes stop_codon:yes gene_type:complete